MPVIDSSTVCAAGSADTVGTSSIGPPPVGSPIIGPEVRAGRPWHAGPRELISLVSPRRKRISRLPAAIPYLSLLKVQVRHFCPTRPLGSGPLMIHVNNFA